VFSRRDKASYRIPLPQGRYNVRLYFAEFCFQKASLRRFAVRSEGESALEGYEPAGRRFATAETQEFTRDVRDGVLDVEFVRESGDPKISAIEIVRADSREPLNDRNGETREDVDFSRE
jgi:hypothetical protein